MMFAGAAGAQDNRGNKAVCGADRMGEWLPYVHGKAVAVFTNQTGMVGNMHLVDTLLKRHVLIKKIFGPEHGFRGTSAAGEEIGNNVDRLTGIPVISMYGQHKKPTPADLQDVDLVIFDIQDVGVRFYTFISSLQYVMEGCIENHKPLLILDRPNPNGFYVDGPVLQDQFRSFVGMQNIPVVYGMTIGEYAGMLMGERLLSPKANREIDAGKINNAKNDAAFLVKVIPCKNYDHNSRYVLPVNPSPNLRDMQAIYLYPGTGFFEGTVISEGRGTDKPFEIFGHPDLPKNLFSFTPLPNEGAKTGKCFYQKCYGRNISGLADSSAVSPGCISLKYLLEAYRLFPGKDSFFLPNNFFNKLAGNDDLMKQVKAGVSENEIRKSWEPALNRFMAVRKKYLLYPDFSK